MSEGVLLPMNAKTASFRASLYANDAGVFPNPDKDELSSLSEILDFFGKPSVLVTNLAKMEVFPIRCANIDIPDLLSDVSHQGRMFSRKLSRSTSALQVP
jgi:hypothetical protein